MIARAPVNRIVHNSAAKSAEVFIYDEIGPSDWGYVGAKGFAEAIRNIGDVTQIDVRINSPGGSMWEASAIYTILSKHPANVTIHIDGIAFSAASYTAMAGDQINMAENAMMMIHLPSGVAFGTAEELRKEATILDQWEASTISVYAARTKIEPQTIHDMLAAETWLTAPQAKEKGFATHIVPNKAVSARVDLSKFKNPPDWAKSSPLLQSSKEPVMALDPTAPAAPAGLTPVVVAPVVTQPVTATAAPAGDLITMSKAEMAKMLEGAVTAAGVARDQRHLDITAMCERVKMPEMAKHFIADPKLQMSDIKDRLIDALVAKNVPIGGDAGAAPELNGGTGADAKYKAEYTSQRAVYSAAGITEEVYIKSRRADDTPV